MKDRFTELLVEFTATHNCSRNWLETVVQWIYTSNRVFDRNDPPSTGDC